MRVRYQIKGVDNTSWNKYWFWYCSQNRGVENANFKQDRLDFQELSNWKSWKNYNSVAVWNLALKIYERTTFHTEVSNFRFPSLLYVYQQAWSASRLHPLVIIAVRLMKLSTCFMLKSLKVMLRWIGVYFLIYCTSWSWSNVSFIGTHFRPYWDI